MAKHHTRNTVSFQKYCGKCGHVTDHRVDGTREGPCLECIAKLQKRHDEKPPVEEKKQGSLF
jgi:hypothetical protein